MFTIVTIDLRQDLDQALCFLAQVLDGGCRRNPSMGHVKWLMRTPRKTTGVVGISSLRQIGLGWEPLTA